MIFLSRTEGHELFIHILLTEDPRPPYSLLDPGGDTRYDGGPEDVDEVYDL